MNKTVFAFLHGFSSSPFCFAGDLLKGFNRSGDFPRRGGSNLPPEGVGKYPL